MGQTNAKHTQTIARQLPRNTKQFTFRIPKQLTFQIPKQLVFQIPKIFQEEPPPVVVVEKRLSVFERIPVLRGMLSYAVVYPLSSLMQQYAGGVQKYDWDQCIQFSIYGSMVVAPSMYYYHRFADWLYPEDTFTDTIKKAILEQIIYSPFSVVAFYYGMGFLQGTPIKEVNEEIREKFWPTYKVGWVYWPVITFLDFFANRRKDSLPVVAQLIPLLAPMAAFWWGYYLSTMKGEEVKICPRLPEREKEFQKRPPKV